MDPGELDDSAYEQSATDYADEEQRWLDKHAPAYEEEEPAHLTALVPAVHGPAVPPAPAFRNLSAAPATSSAAAATAALATPSMAEALAATIATASRWTCVDCGVRLAHPGDARARKAVAAVTAGGASLKIFNPTYYSAFRVHLCYECAEKPYDDAAAAAGTLRVMPLIKAPPPAQIQMASRPDVSASAVTPASGPSGTASTPGPGPAPAPASLDAPGLSVALAPFPRATEDTAFAFPPWTIAARSTLKALYLLADDDFFDLGFVQKPNPTHPTWAPMRLYLRAQAAQLALAKHGSVAQMRELEQRRTVQRLARRTAVDAEAALGDDAAAAVAGTGGGAVAAATAAALKGFDPSLSTGLKRRVKRTIEAAAVAAASKGGTTAGATASAAAKAAGSAAEKPNGVRVGARGRALASDDDSDSEADEEEEEEAGYRTGGRADAPAKSKRKTTTAGKCAASSAKRGGKGASESATTAAKAAAAAPAACPGHDYRVVPGEGGLERCRHCGAEMEFEEL